MKMNRCTFTVAIVLSLCSTDSSACHASPYGQALPGTTETIGLWWCSSGWKVDPKQAVPDLPGEAMIIRAAVNEAEAAQLVICPQRPIQGLKIQATDLCSADGQCISSSAIQIQRVRYVPITQPTDSTGTAGPWPDPLPPLRDGEDLAANCNFPLWICVRVPKGQKAGWYRGTLSARGDGVDISAPLHVEVFGFELPDRMTCKTAFGLDPALIWRYHGLADESQKREVFAKYLQCLSDHHIAPYQPAPLDPIHVRWNSTPARNGNQQDAANIGGTPSRNANAMENRQQVPAGESGSLTPPIPKPEFDFTNWDRAMTQAIDHFHFNTFRLNIPGLGGGTFHARQEPELLGYSEDTPQYRGAMESYLTQLQEHLRDQGWLDEAFVYWFDEPDPKDYAFVNNGFAKLKRWAPEIPRMLTEQVESDLVGGPTIWCPVTSSYNHEAAEQRRLAGEEFWWYVCCGPKAPYCTLFIDHPATELRVWLWQTWQRNIAGILVWESNYWTSAAAYPNEGEPQDPYADPMGWVSGYSTPPGTRRAWGN
ncbi:MAG: hypothetical protein JW829_01590, partial [Pirellulales bacterium]|nr:hypothetical protein [Pirellulales bacterium]